MNSRERVMKALNHEEPDRVPIVFGGSAQKFSDPLMREMAVQFGIPLIELEWVFSGFRFSYYSESLWNRLDIDSRYLNWNHEKKYTLDIQQKGEKYVNNWGLTIEKAAMSLERKPLLGATIEDLEHYPWPHPQMSVEERDSLRRKAKSYRENGFPVFAYRPVVGGIFTISRYLRGDEQFFVDLAIDKPFADALLSRVTAAEMNFYEALLSAVGDSIQVIEIEDDLGAQETSLISLQMYVEQIKPRHKELISFIKEKSPDVKVMIHCDGSIKNLIPSFIDVGIDILKILFSRIFAEWTLRI